MELGEKAIGLRVVCIAVSAGTCILVILGWMGQAEEIPGLSLASASVSG